MTVIDLPSQPFSSTLHSYYYYYYYYYYYHTTTF